MKFIWVLYLLVFPFIASAPAEDVSSDETEVTYDVLSNNVTPFHYLLKIKPYMNTNDEKAFTFDGIVTISFNTSNVAIKELVLNSKLLQFTKDDCKFQSNDASVVDLSFDEDKEIAVLNFGSYLKRNTTYDLIINYQGVIQNETTGFYYSKYKENGVTKYVAQTFFGPNYARTAFPCFDDFSFKTRFTVSIACPNKYTCLSNMPVQLQSGQMILFQKTPPMPTYLLSFVVSQFVVLQESRNALQDLKIWGKLEDKDSAKLAYDTATAMLSFMSQYTGINYFDFDKNDNSRMKHDIVMVPKIAYTGADSWGLMIIDQKNALYNSVHMGVEDKTTVLETVSHQITHLWLENLLSFKNSSDLFLMEGLANYLSYYFTHMRLPQERMDDYIYIEHFKDINSDSDPEKYVLSTFEPLVGKAASLVYMIQSMIGEVPFQNGIKNYIDQYKYTVSTPANLLSACSDAAVEYGVHDYDTTLIEFMKTWTENPGLPLINVKMNHENGEIEISQKQFLEINTTSNRIYYVPISIACESGNFSDMQPKHILKNKVYKTRCQNKSDWVILNMLPNGYYRVNYDEETWNMIIQTLNSDHTKIPKYFRAKLIDDATNLLVYGYMKPKMYTNLFKYLKAEKEFVPIYAVYQAIKNIKNKLYRLEVAKFTDFSAIEEFMLNVLKDHWEDFTINTTHDTYSKKMFRIYIANILCELNDSRCVKEYQKLFNDMKTHKKPIEADLKSSVYCTVLKHGDDKDFDYITSLLETAKTDDERIDIFTLLRCTSKLNKLVELFDKSINGENVVKDKTEKRNLISYLLDSNNPKNVEALFNYMKNNIQHIYETCGTDYVDVLFRYFIDNMNFDHLQQFKKMLKDTEEINNAVGDGNDEILQFLREYKLGVRYVKKFYDYVREEMKNNA